MAKPYHDAATKLAYIKSCVIKGRRIPTDELVKVVETLSTVLEMCGKSRLDGQDVNARSIIAMKIERMIYPNPLTYSKRFVDLDKSHEQKTKR